VTCLNLADPRPIEAAVEIRSLRAVSRRGAALAAAVLALGIAAFAGDAWQVVIRPTTGPATPIAVSLTALAGALAGLLGAVTVLATDAGRRRAERTERALRERAGETERVLHERAERAERALRERQAELTGLAGTAGTHLHAPLHTIAGYTDLLLDDDRPGLDDTAREFLHRIGRSSERMLGLVDELLAYAAAAEAALKLEPVDTERLARDVAAAHRDTAAERPSIDLGELPLVTADGDLLRQVLDQLVANAVRFVRHGTAARITIGARELPDGWWRIEVADRGIGVPQEHWERIFAPFHRTPSADGFPGTGLGLAVCRRIVTLHGGQIGVEPNPGGGSVFWFTVSATGVTVPDAVPELALG
jgi:signal transduction histidine kinase